tara:strand:- start:1125 stop:1427 length:303 start_codon:yes stop_codon:yes gene_type:complete
MKLQKTDTTAVSFGNEVYTNTYVSNYSGETDIKFQDTDRDGSEFKLNVSVPIETARAILAELQQDIENYDAYQAKKAKEKAEEAAAEAAKKAEELQESDS